MPHCRRHLIDYVSKNVSKCHIKLLIFKESQLEQSKYFPPVILPTQRCSDETGICIVFDILCLWFWLNVTNGLLQFKHKKPWGTLGILLILKAIAAHLSSA